MVLGIRPNVFVAIGGALAILGGAAAQTATAEPLSEAHIQRQQLVHQAAGDVRAVDAEVASAGFPFSLTRFYHWDPEAPAGLLGKGWRLSLEARLVPSANTVTLDEADGTDTVFTRQADGSYTAPAGAQYALTAAANAGYSLVSQDGSSREFDATGRLTHWLNAADEGLQLVYTPTGRIASVTDAEGHAAAFSTDSEGRLLRVTFVGGVVTYVYSSQGYLTRVAGVDGSVRTYAYDAQGQLIS
ncbi:DUF6531 domain-containing protein [Streptomyces sp. NPDC006012]|uniref:DUF6531 domain-containing protein n=1 Tax=Streptomyces sp. NPDC006012 TaxID=3364739 RepID=UPI00368CF8CF